MARLSTVAKSVLACRLRPRQRSLAPRRTRTAALADPACTKMMPPHGQHARAGTIFQTIRVEFWSRNSEKCPLSRRMRLLYTRWGVFVHHRNPVPPVPPSAGSGKKQDSLDRCRFCRIACKRFFRLCWSLAVSCGSTEWLPLFFQMLEIV